MPSEPMTVALAHLRELESCLQTNDAASAAPLLDEIGHLSRAVESSHMEGIRFRFFGLRRHLATRTDPAAVQALTVLDDTRRALEAAGFYIN